MRFSEEKLDKPYNLVIMLCTLSNLIKIKTIYNLVCRKFWLPVSETLHELNYTIIYFILVHFNICNSAVAYRKFIREDIVINAAVYVSQI